LREAGSFVDRVAVCDTEPIAIEGLRSLLESAEELSVIAAETTLADGIEAVRELKPSMLMVDKAFGLQAVLDWLASLRGDGQRLYAIVWGSSMTEAEAVRFLQAGARGVARKTAGLDAILDCMRAVALGGTWMDQQMTREHERRASAGHSPLTARETQVMDLVERGMRNKDIAAALGIRTGTVKIHLKHIFEKTGIHGRYGLALSGLKEKGLLALATV